MSADIIQFRPRANPNRDHVQIGTLEQMAAEIFNVALVDHSHEYADTAPSEMLPYCAPEKDPA